MLVEKYFRFIDSGETKNTWAEVYTFPEPVDPGNTLGSEYPEMFKGVDFTAEGFSREPIIGNIINDANVLCIREVVKEGNVISFEIRPGYRLKNITMVPEHHLDIGIWHSENNEPVGFLYIFIAGKDGIFETTALLVKDDEDYLAKLARDIKDGAFRKYIVKKSLADSKMTQELAEKMPEVMTHEQAAKYLQLSKKTLYNNRDIPRLKHNRYSKLDLDKYLAKKKDLKKRR